MRCIYLPQLSGKGQVLLAVQTTLDNRVVRLQHVLLTDIYWPLRTFVMPCSAKWWFVYYYAASLITLLRGCDTFLPDVSPDTATCIPVEPSRRFCPFEVSVWNTSYPNVFNHTSFSQAAFFLSTFADLFESGCSEHLSYFLCYATFPLCFAGTFHKVEPCQEMCVAVRESCTPFLNNNGREWPSELSCNKFPPDRSKMCVWSGKSCSPVQPNIAASTDPNSQFTTKSMKQKTFANCTGHLVRYPNSSQTQYGGIDNCGERCLGVLLTEEEQNFNMVWIAIWSLLCMVTSIISFVTWILNYKAIKSPESPVYYIALSYFFTALSYTLSIALGEERIICNPEIKNKLNESALIVNGLHFSSCTALFSITYIFTVSSWVWWALLNVEWLICSVKLHAIGIKWRTCSQFVGWGVPIVFLLIALGTESVGGNSILRTCWISKDKEVPYLIGPLLTLIVFSCVVIMIALSRVTKLRRVFKDTQLAKEEMNRIAALIQVGLYCIVYLIAMGILLCCYWYEYWYRELWEHSYIDCVHNSTLCASQQKPVFNIIKMKFAVSLIMGIVTGAWIFKKSSTRAWHKVCCIFCSLGNRRRNPQLRQSQFTNGPYAAQYSFSETSV